MRPPPRLVFPRDLIGRGPGWIAIDKPPGLPARPSPGHASSALAELETWIAVHEPQSPRPGVVHRLDLETSGVLVFSAGPRGHRALVEAFAHRRVRKEYWAAVDGWPSPRRGDITLRLSRNASGRTVVDPRGTEAATSYETIRRVGRCAVLRVRPRTGRTHQIRVHLAARGTPIVGDLRYGRRDKSLTPLRPRAPRLGLHAAQLILPPEIDGEPHPLSAPLPPDLVEWIARLEALSRGSDGGRARGARTPDGT